MSDPLRIALVAEGATEREVIDAALKVILAPRSFVLTQLQPEATKPDIGGGWGGVLKWCHQLAARSQRGGGAVEARCRGALYELTHAVKVPAAPVPEMV